MTYGDSVYDGKGATLKTTKNNDIEFEFESPLNMLQKLRNQGLVTWSCLVKKVLI